ncbi:MAG: hypothetical protein WCQ99_04990 [Pseudomonadota bacterium]
MALYENMGNAVGILQVISPGETDRRNGMATMQKALCNHSEPA